MLRSSRRDVVHRRGPDVSAIRTSPAKAGGEPAAGLRHRARLRLANRCGAPRTIVVQDALRPYLASDGAIDCRDFHIVFHSLCGSIPEPTIQRR
jgi:hypothetical protein